MKKNVFKKAAIAVSVLASVSLFVACGSDPVDPGDGDDGGGGTPTPGTPDTIFAMTVVHPQGWSKVLDEVTPAISSVSYDSATAVAGEAAHITLVRGAQPTVGQDPWPQADILGAMFAKEGTGSLAKLDSIEITYKVIAASDGVKASDGGISFKITQDYVVGIETADWATFHAVLTNALKNIKPLAD